MTVTVYYRRLDYRSPFHGVGLPLEENAAKKEGEEEKGGKRRGETFGYHEVSSPMPIQRKTTMSTC